MEQSFDIILPAAQLEGTSATLAKWLVALGDTIVEGEPVIELETDKVSMEICAPAAGVLSQIIANEGEEINVDSVLGIISNKAVHNNVLAGVIVDEVKADEVKADEVKADEVNIAEVNIAEVNIAEVNIAEERSPLVDNEQLVADIILPASQLEGTSATLAKWLVNLGEHVNEGTPIIELETDKVSMEICAPITGTLTKINANEGDSIIVDTILGQLTSGQQIAVETIKVGNENSSVHAMITERLNKESILDKNSAHHLIGPAVRRLLKEHSLNIDLILGTGRRGRVTRNDVLAYLANAPVNETPTTVSKTVNEVVSATMPYLINQPVSRPLQGTMVPHTNMRKAIANHMVSSLLETSPHVTSIFEMDMSNIIAHRKWHKKEFAQQGVKLTFTAYFLAAIVKSAQAVPQVNARFHQDALELFADINIGVGTALGDAGLVVPVVQQVQTMSLFDIAHALTTQTEKARNGKLTPADMKHGTFTISNHGVSGSLIATPIIINQPQVAILGVGKLEKRVVVEEVAGVDTMVIRPKCYVSLSIDHRALDAHQTNLFLAKFVEVIEAWGE
ncbi:MAG: 2-oxoglutarate dehydrogenase E2 component (dihydrolipoamide succinyltransferase) [Alteromonadaceae bacterium]|jgi:2-oxoglutarate dehydrogenase E2 component (dihydrolipoamide succinyltransferase)